MFHNNPFIPSLGASGVELNARLYDVFPNGQAVMVDRGPRRVSDAEAQWPEARVILQHRLGVIPVGEASIAIAAAAPHRAEAFAACRFVIEAVKQRLPVWKKEIHADGSSTWVDPTGHPVTNESLR